MRKSGLRMMKTRNERDQKGWVKGASMEGETEERKTEYYEGEKQSIMKAKHLVKHIFVCLR